MNTQWSRLFSGEQQIAISATMNHHLLFCITMSSTVSHNTSLKYASMHLLNVVLMQWTLGSEKEVILDVATHRQMFTQNG